MKYLPWERAGVRGCRTYHVRREYFVSTAPPHPNPLADGEGTRHARCAFCAGGGARSRGEHGTAKNILVPDVSDRSQSQRWCAARFNASPRSAAGIGGG